MRAEGLVASLIVFGVVLPLPIVDKLLTDQRQRKPTLNKTRAKPPSVTAILHLAQSISSKSPPAERFHFESGDIIREFKKFNP